MDEINQFSNLTEGADEWSVGAVKHKKKNVFYRILVLFSEMTFLNTEKNGLNPGVLLLVYD